MTHEKQIIITAKEGQKRKKRLHSLPELAEHVAQAEQKAAAESSSNALSKPKKPRSILRRVMLWVGCSLGIPLIILIAGLLYITSPAAEQRLTSLVVSGVNYLGKPHDLRVHIGLLRGFWNGELKIYNVRVQDKFGPWLYVDEGTIHPDWKSILSTTLAVFQYQRSGSVGEHLYNKGRSISNLKQEQHTYTQDNSSTFSASYDTENSQNIGSILNDAGTEATTAKKDSTSEQIDDIEQRKSVPMVVVPYDPDLMDNLLEPANVLKNKVVIGIKVGTLLGVRMPRFPRYLASSEDSSPIESKKISLMPSWFALDIAEFELADFQLGPSGRDVFISARFQGQISSNQARVRTTLLAEKTSSGQWVLPYTQDLPADVTLSMRELYGKSNLPMADLRSSARDFFAEKKFLGFMSLDYNVDDVDLRVQWRDTLIGPHFVEGLDGFWSRFRVLVNVPTWPPTDEKPLQAQFVSRFGATFAQANSRLKASLASAQIYWGKERFILRDLNVLSPIKNTNISLKGGLGFDPKHSFGTQFKLSIKDLGIIADILDVDIKQSGLGGSIDIDTYITRGGRHLLWWTKPLPPIQVGRSLPGLLISPYDFSILAQDVSAAVRASFKSLRGLHGYIAPAVKETRLPPASKKDDAMQMRIKIASPQLKLSSGDINDIFLNINAKSVDALKAPATTAYKDKESAAMYASGQGKAELVDFTSDGIARGLVGTVFSRLGEVHGQGAGGLTANWFLGGLHDESRTLQLELENFALNLPGVSNTADIGFAYALPIVKRNWPWIDGKVSLNVDHWRWIGLVTGSSVRGNNVNLSSEFKSFLDAQGVPRQYLNTTVQADRLDSTQFIVRNIYGSAESQNVHDLADILALSTGKLREALEKKLVYKPSPDIILLKSKLQLGAGSSGGFSWDRGEFDLGVVDENANFTVKMNGDISAILNGSYDFRKRVVSLKKMQFIER